jgi:hypothetical protein
MSKAYSGPASAYGLIGKTEDAYFKMVDDQGGVNGRKINFITYDDGTVQVQKQAGDNLTRENVMKPAASLKDFAPDTLIPGIKVNTQPPTSPPSSSSR